MAVRTALCRTLRYALGLEITAVGMFVAGRVEFDLRKAVAEYRLVVGLSNQAAGSIRTYERCGVTAPDRNLPAIAVAFFGNGERGCGLFGRGGFDPGAEAGLGSFGSRSRPCDDRRE